MALDLPECTVSTLVATVGAVDLLLLYNGSWREAASSTEVKLSRECGEPGVEKERWPGLPLLLVVFSFRRADC